jgi:hypothetical protein
MSSRASVLIFAPALLGLAACGQTMGDFGRPEPSVLHDSLLPALGGAIADQGRGELVSDFNETDREKTMRDRAWTLVQPPHLNDWFGNTLVEFQRTRILPELDTKYNVKAYYELLRRDPYISSETRWHRLVDDMTKDAQLIAPFWQELRRVNADDQQRVRSLDHRADLTPAELHNAYARIDENARLADWVWRSMRFRLKSYRLCIDRMLVETPTDQQWAVNQAYDRLQTAIALAEQNTSDFRLGGETVAVVKHSRYLSPYEIDHPASIK